GGIRICLRSRSDVAALVVEDRDEAQFFRTLQNGLLRQHPRGPACLEESALRFYNRNERRYQIEHTQTEFLEGPRHRPECAVVVPLTDLQRQQLPARVDADAERVAFGAAGGQ